MSWANNLEQFYSSIVNSTYVDKLAEFSTPTQNIGRGSYIGSYDYTKAKTGEITRNDIELGLRELIDKSNEFINKELILFSMADNALSIPNVVDRNIMFAWASLLLS
jgi:hypothetical protein